MRSLPLALLVMAVGCGFSGPPGTGDGDGDGDAGVDAIPCTATWEAINFDVCGIGNPGGPLDLGGGAYTYNTSTGILSEPGGGSSEPPSVVDGSLTPPARVLYAESFSLAQGSELALTGAHPLIIASESTIDVGGFIDAASLLDQASAGAQPAACAAVAPGIGTDGDEGAGGGGGGGNQAAGGDGGEGDSNDNPRAGGPAGQTLGIPDTPRGGCAGGDGGNDSGAGGLGGAGGGAIQLSAATRIDLRATSLIAASGGGGEGGNAAGGGGGGGGSGGFIGLDSIEVTAAAGARLIANGGGGGGGAGTGDGSDGGSKADTEMPAPGGAGGSAPAFSDTSAGGDGGCLLAPAETVTFKPTRGAGGGGGGGGYVVIWSTTGTIDASAVLSPVAQQPGR